MDTKKKYIIGFSVLILLLLAVVIRKMDNKKEGSDVAEKNISAVSEKKKIRLVSIQGDAGDNWLSDFGIEKGIFAKHGIEIEKISTDKNPTALINSGGADLTISGLGGALSAYLSGEDLHVIYLTATPFSYVGASRFTMDNLREIKKIGVNRLGGDNHMLAIAALKNLGLDPNTLEFIALPSAQARAEMLKKGEIDFALGSDGDLKASGIDSDSATIIDSETLFSNGFKKGMVTSSKVLAEKNDAVRAFVAGIDEALKYAESHKDELAKMMREKNGYSEQDANKFIGKFELASKDENVPRLEDIQPLFDILHDNLHVPVEGKTIDQFIYADIAKNINQ